MRISRKRPQRGGEYRCRELSLILKAQRERRSPSGAKKHRIARVVFVGTVVSVPSYLRHSPKLSPVAEIHASGRACILLVRPRLPVDHPRRSRSGASFSAWASMTISRRSCVGRKTGVGSRCCQRGRIEVRPRNAGLLILVRGIICGTEYVSVHAGIIEPADMSRMLDLCCNIAVDDFAVGVKAVCASAKFNSSRLLSRDWLHVHGAPEVLSGNHNAFTSQFSLECSEHVRGIGRRSGQNRSPTFYPNDISGTLAGIRQVDADRRSLRLDYWWNHSNHDSPNPRPVGLSGQNVGGFGFVGDPIASLDAAFDLFRRGLHFSQLAADSDQGTIGDYGLRNADANRNEGEPGNPPSGGGAPTSRAIMGGLVLFAGAAL
jgi:hypothetical protein